MVFKRKVARGNRIFEGKKDEHRTISVNLFY